MTEQFYRKLVEFLNASDKQAILACLAKHKYRIKGFRSLKEAPPQVLATMFFRNESDIIHYLKEIGETYASIDDALKDFKAGNVAKAFSFVLSNHDITEDQLLAIIESAPSEVPTSHFEKDIQDLQTKLLEAKAKAQSTRKDYLLLKKEHGLIKKENEQLQSELNITKNTIAELIEHAEKAEERAKEQDREIELLRKQYGEQIHVLKKENELLRAQNEEAEKSPILVLLREWKSIPLKGVFVRTYDFISTLTNESSNDYSEILYVFNEMPLSFRIKIQRLEEAQKRVKIFTTNYELLQYVKEARK